MSTATRPPISPPSIVRASTTIVWRNLLHIRRMPEMLLDVTVQSVMFVLLFAFVFGGSIAVAGSSYREFLLPGIMVQTMVFSSAIVAMGLTNDLQKAFDFALRSESGMVHINDTTVSEEPHFAFGGVKGSGFGREGGHVAIEEMTELKWITVQMGKRQYPF